MKKSNNKKQILEKIEKRREEVIEFHKVKYYQKYCTIPDIDFSAEVANDRYINYLYDLFNKLWTNFNLRAKKANYSYFTTKKKRGKIHTLNIT